VLAQRHQTSPTGPLIADDVIVDLVSIPLELAHALPSDFALPRFRVNPILERARIWSTRVLALTTYYLT